MMKASGLGKNGHIAIRTNSVVRAMDYLEAKGYEFDMGTMKYDESGKPVTVYFKNEFGGFAIHLLQKK